MLRLFYLQVALCGAMAGCQAPRAELVSSPAPFIVAPDAHESARTTELPIPGSVGSRIFVPERSARRLAVYDLESRRVLPQRMKRLGATDDASLAFAPDLERGYVLSSDGKLSELELASLRVTRSLQVGMNTRELTLSRDGATLALSASGGRELVLVDVRSLSVKTRISTDEGTLLRVLALPEQFACVLAEPARVWFVERSEAGAQFAVTRVLSAPDAPSDALLAGDDRQLLLAHGPQLARISSLALTRLDAGFRSVDLQPLRSQEQQRGNAQGLPKVAWTWAAGKLFVTQPWNKRLAVLDPESLRRVASVALPGSPASVVYSPTGREVWVVMTSEAGAPARVQALAALTLELRSSFELPAQSAHISFTPYGPYAIASAELEDQLFLFDARRHELLASAALRAPARALGPWRALRADL